MDKFFKFKIYKILPYVYREKTFDEILILFWKVSVNHVTYGFAIYKRVSEWGIAERLADETWIPLVRFKSAVLFFSKPDHPY